MEQCHGTPFGACIDFREWRISLQIVIEFFNLFATARRANDVVPYPQQKLQGPLIKAPLGTEFCRHCFDVFHLPVSAVVFKKNAKNSEVFSVGHPAAARRMSTAAHPSPPDVPRLPLPLAGTPPPGAGPGSPSAVATDDLDDAGRVRPGRRRRRLRRRGCRGGKKVNTFRGTQGSA